MCKICTLKTENITERNQVGLINEFKKMDFTKEKLNESK